MVDLLVSRKYEVSSVEGSAHRQISSSSSAMWCGGGQLVVVLVGASKIPKRHLSAKSSYGKQRCFLLHLSSSSAQHNAPTAPYPLTNHTNIQMISNFNRTSCWYYTTKHWLKSPLLKSREMSQNSILLC